MKNIKNYEELILIAQLKNIKNYEELNKYVKEHNLIGHHMSTYRKYVSRKKTLEVEPYEGRFGKGIRVLFPRWDSSIYCNCQYYIERGDEE